MVNTRRGRGSKHLHKTHLIKLQLPQFTTRRRIKRYFKLFDKWKSDRYDVTIGRTLQQAIGLDILNQQQVFEWMEITVSMTQVGHWNRKLVTVHMDYMNLIQPSTQLSSNQVLRKRLTLEEYRVTLKYIKGAGNVVVDALSRFPFTETTKNKEEWRSTYLRPLPRLQLISAASARTKRPIHTDLACIRTLLRYHCYIQDRKTQGVSLTYYNSLCHIKETFRIFVLTNICAKIIQWYHGVLLYSVFTRMTLTL